MSQDMVAEQQSCADEGKAEGTQRERGALPMAAFKIETDEGRDDAEAGGGASQHAAEGQDPRDHTAEAEALFGDDRDRRLAERQPQPDQGKRAGSNADAGETEVLDQHDPE